MTRREKTQRRRAQIAETTLALLGETPLEQLTTRQIAKALGISQPALFRHFRSREQILLATVEHVREQLSVVAQAVFEGEGAATEQSSALAQLRGLARGLLGHVAEHPGLPRMLFAPPGRGPVRDALAALVSTQAALVGELVRQGQRDGSMAKGLDAARAARSFVGMIQGAVLHAQLFGREAELAAEAEPLVALWLDGARARTDGDAEVGADRRTGVPHATVAAGRALGAVTAPAQSAAPPREPLGALDVAPILAAGADPLEAILARLEPLVAGDVLALSAPFRPAPLLTLLRKRGFGAFDRTLPDGSTAVDIVAGGAPDIDDLVDLEPPEPLERVLTVTATMQPAEIYLARLPRFPQLLLPHLRQRGLTWQTHVYADQRALLRVARPAASDAARDASSTEADADSESAR